MMAMQLGDLAPCPKCGSRNFLSPCLQPGTAFIECSSCGIKGPEVCPIPESDVSDRAGKAWNSQMQAMKKAT